MMKNSGQLDPEILDENRVSSTQGLNASEEVTPCRATMRRRIRVG